MEKKKSEHKKKVETFQLPAGYRREELRKKAGFHRSSEIQVERVGNAREVFRILDAIPEAMEKQGERSFQECIDELTLLSLEDDPRSFFQKYDEFRKSPGFLGKLQKRLLGRKIRLSLDKNEFLGPDSQATTWSIVSCDDIAAHPEDPAVRIREDLTGREYNIFLVDLLSRLTDH